MGIAFPVRCQLGFHIRFISKRRQAKTAGAKARIMNGRRATGIDDQWIAPWEPINHHVTHISGPRPRIHFFLSFLSFGWAANRNAHFIEKHHDLAVRTSRHWCPSIAKRPVSFLLTTAGQCRRHQPRQNTMNCLTIRRKRHKVGVVREIPASPRQPSAYHLKEKWAAAIPHETGLVYAAGQRNLIKVLFNISIQRRDTAIILTIAPLNHAISARMWLFAYKTHKISGR